MTRSIIIAMMASAAMLTVSACSDSSAPACDDGDVEDLVANLVRDRLATAAPFHYALSAQARADLEDRVTAAAKNKEEAIFAELRKKDSAIRAGDAAYRAAIDARQDRIREIRAAEKRESDSLAEERSTAWRAAMALDTGRERAVEKTTGEFRRKERALSERFRQAFVREHDAARKEREAAKKAAYDAAYDRETHERAIIVAADELRSAKSALADAREAIRERAVDDALNADVELDDVITVELLDEFRWSLCEATVTASVDATLQGRIDGVAFTVTEAGIRPTASVQYEARYTADRKQIRVTLNVFRL